MRVRSVLKKIRGRFSRSASSTASANVAKAAQPFVEPNAPAAAPASLSELNGDPKALGSHVDQAAQAHAAADRLGRTTTEVIEHAPDAWETVDSTVKLLKDAASGLKILGQVLSGIGEVHPYVQAVTAVINGAIVKPILSQDARDEAFEALLGEMIRTFDLVKRELHPESLAPTKPLGYQQKLLTAILRESETCATFIKDEYVAKKFWSRAAKNFLHGGEVDERLQAFRTAFANFRETWRDEKLMHLEASSVLDKLQRATDAGHTSEKACLPNTRVQLLHELSEWIETSDGTQALFLLGVAGSGKSSVAHSFFERCQESGILGAFFSFDRAATNRQASHAVSSLAYHLAVCHQDYRDELVRVLKADPKLADSTNVARLWGALILAPLHRITYTGTILIVVDALDECPGDPPRQALLERLTASVTDLPGNVRIFATSRAESDVVRALRRVDSVARIDLADCTASEDIHVYVRARLQADLADDCLGDEQCTTLGDAADGLFQWAATMCAFLLDRPGGSSLHERFDRRIKLFMQGDIRSPPGRPSLNELYIHILSSCFDSEDQIAMQRYRNIMAMVLRADEGITLENLQSIHSLAEPSDTTAVGMVLRSLGALMEGVSGRTSIVRPMHTSFRDFLLDAGRSGVWYLSPDTMHMGRHLLILGMLRLLARDLRFNMARVPSPLYLQGQNHRLVSELPSALVHSAIYCMKHIPHSEDVSTSMGASRLITVRTAFREILFDKLLFLLEALAITDRPSFGGTELSLSMASWMFLVEPQDLEARMLLDDALRFVRYFLPTIQISVAHLYMSALPFAPLRSLVRQRYMQRFAGLPKVSPSPRLSWPLDDRVPYPNLISPICMACAPGMVVAIGNSQGQIQVFDVTIRCPPFPAPELLTGDSGSPVLAIVYPSRISCIVSGHEDGCVRFWDASVVWVRRRMSARAAPKVHSSAVVSISLTPDEQYLVSSSADGVMCNWSVRLATALWTINTGHSHQLTCVACCPDGLRVLSSSLDGTVRIWDLASGEAMGQVPLTLGCGISHVSYAPCGTRLAVAFLGATSCIQILDAESNHLVGQLPGHESRITSLAWSPDSSHLASSSNGEREPVKVWDTRTMHPVVEGSTRWSPDTRSVVFSPEGDLLYACDRYCSSCHSPAYDMKGYLGNPQFFPHSPAYSDDGVFIRAEGSDGESRCWLVSTGVLVDPPSDTTWRSSTTKSTDGRFSLTRTPDGDFIVHDRQSETPLEPVLTLPSTEYVCCDLAPDGSLLAAGAVEIDRMGQLNEWNFMGDDDLHIQRGVCVWDLHHTKREHGTQCCKTVSHLTFSPNSKEIAVCLEDGTVATWAVDEFWPAGRTSGLHLLAANFTPQPTVDPATNLPYADAHLRATRPHIEIPREYTPQLPTAGTRRQFYPPPLVIDFANAHHGTDWAKCYRGEMGAFSTGESA